VADSYEPKWIWNSVTSTARMLHGPKMRTWTDQEAAGPFRPFTVPKRHSMFIKTCRALTNGKERISPSSKTAAPCHKAVASRYRLMAPSYSWVRRNTFLAKRNRVGSVVSPPDAAISSRTTS